MKNEIDSYSSLEGYLNQLESLSQEIEKTLTELKNIFANQQTGWASSNSLKEASKMDEYINETKKLSTNVAVIKQAISKFKNATQDVDLI